MIDKVDQESEEYLKWKQGSVPVEEPQEPIEPEEVVEELPEPKRSKIFFMDWFFGVETHMGQMKMMYYSFTFFFYYLFCVYMAYAIERIDKAELNILEIIYLFFLAIPVAIILPLVLLVAGLLSVEAYSLEYSLVYSLGCLESVASFCTEYLDLIWIYYFQNLLVKKER